MADNDPRMHNYVYDGKRLRDVLNRSKVDYSSSVIYTKFNPSPLIPPISQFITTKLRHVSVNKFKCTINTIKWIPDGRRLISGASTGEFTLWNGYSFNFETILQAHESPVRSMCWSPTGSFLVSGDTLGILKYWHPSMSNIQLINAHSESIRDISFGPFDNKFCSCSDDGSVKVWDSKEAKEEVSLKIHGWDVKTAQWHPTKALIASGGKDNALKLSDPRGNEILALHIHKNTIFNVKWSACGNFLYSGSKDQTVKMTDITNMKTFTYKTYGKDVTGIGVHPHYDDLFVSGCGNGSLIFYKKFCEEPLKIVEKAHENIIWCAEYHPMGHVLATGSLDQSCRFWINDDGCIDENVEMHDEKESEEDSLFIPGL
ncbi:WD repeat-containing protein 33 [Gurleya vavrai]